MPKSVYITVIYCEDLGMTEWARLCTHALAFICIPWFAMHTYINFFHAITCITVAQQPGLHTTIICSLQVTRRGSFRKIVKRGKGLTVIKLGGHH